MHLHLFDAGQLILDWVLDREDFPVLPVEMRERGVERGGLARPRGPGDQKEPAGLFDDVGDLLCNLRREAQLVPAKACRSRLSDFVICGDRPDSVQTHA